MKKNVVYNIDIALDEHGVISECQCDCGAGMGPDAHCKHICATFYAAIEFTNTGILRVHETCTSKLMTFHQTKKVKGSPQSHYLTTKIHVA